MTQDALARIYDRIRTEEHAALAARVTDAFARAPRLSEIDAARSRLFSEVGARVITPKEGVARLAALEREEADILHALHLPPDALTLHYRCEACRDTGFVGDAPKRPCACRLRYREGEKHAGRINERETFERFSESVYRQEEQLRRAINAKKRCMAYADALPHPEKPNLLLLGMPGLGKSYLGNAVAASAIGRGIDAERVTTYRFVQDMLLDIREHTNFARRYSAVPLLVLDDLGSEPLIPNVSVEWLFAVVNERAMNRLATVCITNLTLKQLQERYGERLMSRLVDANTTTAIRLTGENLRTQRGGEPEC